MKIKTKTMRDGTKAKIHIKEEGDQYKTFTQVITKVFPNSVNVISAKGNEYNVALSDRVRMTMKAEKGDLAVIMPLDTCWIVTDLIQEDKMPTDETAVTDPLEKLERRKNRYILEGRSLEEIKELEKQIEIEYQKEVERQQKEFEDMFGGY